ncbi:MAG: hypothetical protein HZC42_08715 [Candidatus Eisenbacteria bacterium]|nr:hypothetical protein [Candidatus Eisenbacteria bacterium]
MALRVVLRSVTDCNAMYRRLAKSMRAPRRPGDIDDICITIRASIDWVAVIKELFGIVQDVRLVRPRVMGGSMERMLQEHDVLFQRLRSSRLEGCERMSTLLALIQIELVFLGHMW